MQISKVKLDQRSVGEPNVMWGQKDIRNNDGTMKLFLRRHRDMLGKRWTNGHEDVWGENKGEEKVTQSLRSSNKITVKGAGAKLMQISGHQGVCQPSTQFAFLTLCSTAQWNPEESIERERGWILGEGLAGHRGEDPLSTNVTYGRVRQLSCRWVMGVMNSVIRHTDDRRVSMNFRPRVPRWRRPSRARFL